MGHLVTPVAFAGALTVVLATFVHPALGVLVAVGALAPLYGGLVSQVLRDPIVAFGLLFPQLYLFNMVTGIWSHHYAQLLVVGLFIWMIVRIFLDDWTLKRLPLRYATWLALFMAWVFLSASMSFNAERSFFAAGHYLFYVLALVALNQLLSTRHRVLRFFEALVVGATLYSLAVCGLLLPATLQGGLLTLISIKGELLGINTNGVPIPLIVCIPFVFIRCLDRPDHRLRNLLALGTISLAILLTLSRSAWVGSAAGLFFLFVLYQLKAGRAQRLLLAGLALAGLSVVVLIAAGDQFSALSGLERGTTGRIYLWEAARGMIADHPITGIGPGMWEVFDASYAAYDGPIDLTHYAAHAHNTYLMHTAELGIPGGLLATALLVMLLHDSVRGAFDSALPRSYRLHLLGCAGVVIVIATRGLFESTLLLWPGGPASSAWLAFVAVSVARFREPSPEPTPREAAHAG